MTIKIGIATSPFRESFQHSFGQEIPIVKPNPSLEELSEYDLIIFSGGSDISSRFYGEPITYTRGVDHERDKIESDILDKALLLGIKVFGVCRGHQLINAKLGGKLVQDLFMGQKPNIIHSSPHPLEKISPDIFLKDIDVVNSLHHQGVISSGKGLQRTSRHKGIIESTIGKNIYSVQFHPEFMLRVKEIRTFFDVFKTYVGENSSKKDPSKLSLNDISDNRKSRPSILPQLEGLDIRIRGTENIGEFVQHVRNYSDLTDTELQLNIVPEHETHLRNIYERKRILHDSVDSLQARDEELYVNMEQGNYNSDEEFELMGEERTFISDEVETKLHEISSLNTTLTSTAREMRESINEGNWDNTPEPEEPVRISTESATYNSSDIDWSSIRDRGVNSNE